MNRLAHMDGIIAGASLAVVLIATALAFLSYLDPVFVLTFASSANFCN
ncbi:hypothetical protein [uncultured Bradyrhizobium sp.]